MSAEKRDAKLNITAEEKCENDLNDTAFSLSGLYCPGMFDGWVCWNHTPAGEFANHSCPSFVTGFEPDRLAYKKCNEDGTWFRLGSDNKTWTNYTTCINWEDLLWQQQVISVYKAGYSASLVALIISLALLSYFRSIRCPRIVLHMNLFFSFAIDNILWLVWYEVVVLNPQIVMNNGVGCQLLHVVLHYFLLTNYAWMLCEGLYLHTILVSAFVAESRLMLGMHALGWIVPFFFIIPYSVARLLVPKGTDDCWTEDGWFNNILSGPVCVSMVLNLLFLCNIVRVLLVKLRAGPHVGYAAGNNGSRPSRTALQALRATLLLVPLLGLNYLLTPFRPPKNNPFVKTYDIMSAITASFQGLWVTFLFCFCNSEVISQVKRKWQTLMFRPRANSYTATTTVSVCQYVSGEEQICLNTSASKKHLHRNLANQKHHLQASDGATDKVNV